MPQSVLEAIRLGIWDYEPPRSMRSRVTPTGALPGTAEKLDVLAERLRLGLPLWHPEDRLSYEEDAE